MRHLIAASLMLVLAACATPPAEQQAAIDSKPVCCESLADISYGTLEPDKLNIANLDETAKVFNFGKSKGHFVAYNVAGDDKRYIFVKSYFNGILVGQYLLPIFHFLDDRHQPIRSSIPRMKFTEGNLFGPERNDHMAGIVQIPPDASYVVITNNTNDLPAETAQQSPQVTALLIGGSPVVMTSQGAAVKLTHSPMGQLKLQIFTPQFPAAKP